MLKHLIFVQIIILGFIPGFLKAQEQVFSFNTPLRNEINV